MSAEELTWIPVANTVSKRMMGHSLVHKLVPCRRLRRRTKALNTVLKKLHSLRSYSQYVKIKTSVLRNLSDDSDTDDNASFTEEDYGLLYKSDMSMQKYFAETSRNEVDVPYEEESDVDECIVAPNTSKSIKRSIRKSSQNVSLGWQKVIKKKHKAAVSSKNDSDVGFKKLTKKESKKESKKVDNVAESKYEGQRKASPRKSLERACKNKRVSNTENHAIDNNKAVEEKTITSQCKEVSEHVKITNKDKTAPQNLYDDEKILENNENSANHLACNLATGQCHESQNGISLSHHIAGLNTKENLGNHISQGNTTDALTRKKDLQSGIPDDNEANEITTQEHLENNFTRENGTNELDELGTQDLQENNSVSDKTNVLAMKKQAQNDSSHNSGTNKLTIKKNVQVDELDRKEDVKEDTSHNIKTKKASIKKDLLKYDPYDNKTNAIKSVKKNLTDVLSGCSLVCGAKAGIPENIDINDTIDTSKCRLSNIYPLGRSTPLPMKEKAQYFQEFAHDTNHPKDSGIDDDSQEELSENGKIIIGQPTENSEVLNNSTLSLSSESNSDDFSEHPTIIINPDISGAKLGETTEEDLERTLIIDNTQCSETPKKEEETQRHKSQPKVTCTEIVNKKYKIITGGPLDDFKLEKECLKTRDDPLQHAHNNVDKINKDEPKDNQDSETSNIKKDEALEEYTEDENLDESISPSTKKKLQQLRRLDLTADSSSSEDETECQPKYIMSTPKKEFENKKHGKGKNNKLETTILMSKKDNSPNKKSKKSKSCLPELHTGSTDHNENISEEDDVLNDKQDSLDVEDVQEKGSSKEGSFPQEDEVNLGSGNEDHAENFSACPSYSTETEKDSLDFDTESTNSREYKKENTKRREDRDVGVEIRPSVEAVGTQTDIHIPITRRPNNLQEFIQQEELVPDTTPPAFYFKDMCETELYIIDIPKTVTNEQLLGKKLVFKNNKLKLGSQKYKPLYKKVDAVTCVFGSGKSRKPFKAVKVNPVATIVTRAHVAEDVVTPKTSAKTRKPKEKPDSKPGWAFAIENFQENTNKFSFKRKRPEANNAERKKKKQEQRSTSPLARKQKQRKRIIVCDDDRSSTD